MSITVIYHGMSLMYCTIKPALRAPLYQSRMDNPETLATLGTQVTGQRVEKTKETIDNGQPIHIPQHFFRMNLIPYTPTFL